MKYMLHILSLLFIFSGMSAYSQTSSTGDQRVKRILDAKGLNYTMTTTGDFKLTFDLGENRSQLVFINSKTEKYNDWEVREVWSPAYKFETAELPVKVANRLLSNSWEKIIGAWQTHNFSGNNLASFAVKVSADLTDQELFNLINTVVKVADGMEKELTGNDDF